MKTKKTPEEQASYRRLLFNFIGVNVTLLLALALLVLFAHLRIIRPGGCLCVRLFGFYCPACGGTRATLSLLRGELLASLRYNPAVPVMAAVATYFEVSCGLSVVSGRMRFAESTLWKLLFLIPLAFGLVFLLRNGLLLLGIDTLGDILGQP